MSECRFCEAELLTFTVATMEWECGSYIPQKCEHVEQSKDCRIKQLEETACEFLMWFNSDGTPCDGFRFQEQRKKLSRAVGFVAWYRQLLNRKRTGHKKKDW